MIRVHQTRQRVVKNVILQPDRSQLIAGLSCQLDSYINQHVAPGKRQIAATKHSITVFISICQLCKKRLFTKSHSITFRIQK